jgi:hypothetical protein
MTSTFVVMISRSCIPTLDLSAALSFDPGEFIMFKLMVKLRTEGAAGDGGCNRFGKRRARELT